MAIFGRRYPIHPLIKKNKVSTTPVASRPVIASSFPGVRYSPGLAAFRPLRPITIKAIVPTPARAFIAPRPFVVSFTTSESSHRRAYLPLRPVTIHPIVPTPARAFFAALSKIVNFAATKFNPGLNAFRPLKLITIRTYYKFIFPTTMNRPAKIVSFAATRFSPDLFPFRPLHPFTVKPGPKPPVPVPGPFVRTSGSLIARDPSAGRMLDQRLRRLTELVSSIVNSLYGQGILIQTDADTWKIVPGNWSGPRPPSVGDDSTVGIKVGTIWVDTLAGKAYVNISNAPGMAVWALIT